jgi:cob(I)alamin adenosyltransferase
MALEYAKKLANKGLYRLLVLDEISHALRRNLLPIEDVIEFLHNKPTGLEIVLTGRGMAQEIIDLADVVTESKPVKHPYAEGMPSRRGIEY